MKAERFHALRVWHGPERTVVVEVRTERKPTTTSPREYLI